MRSRPDLSPPKPVKRPIHACLPYALALLTLVVGVGSTAFGVSFLGQQNEAKARSLFEECLDRIEREIRYRFALPVHMLNGVTGLYAASEQVEREEFDSYVGSRNLVFEAPGVLGLGFAEPVKRSQLQGFVSTRRAKGLARFQVHGGGALEDMLVVSFVAPLVGNSKVHGFDLASDPILREAAEHATRTGQPTLSGHVTLMHDDDPAKHGFIYMAPVYRRGADPTTPERRIEALVGILSAPIVIDAIMADVVKAAESLLDVDLFDGSGQSAANLVYDADKHLHGLGSAIQPAHYAGRRFETSRALLIGDRALTLRVSTTQAFESRLDHAGPVWLGGAGLTISLLMSLAVWLLAAGRDRARAIARDMTADLQRLSMVAERTTDAVILIDARGLILWVNEGFTRSSGYTPHEAIGQSARTLLHSETADPAAELALHAATNKGLPFRGELMNKRKDGVSYWLDVEVQPLRDEQGRLTGFVAIQSDITAAKAAASDLARERRRLNNILEGTHVGTVELRVDTGEMLVNERLANMLGYSLAELTPLHQDRWRTWVHEEDLPALKHQLIAHLSGKLPYAESEMRMTSKSGDIIWVLLRAKLSSRLKNGRPKWVAGTVMDVTSRKRVEQALAEQRQKMHAVTAGVPGVVHEFELAPDGTFRFVFLSEAVREMFGIDPEAGRADASLLFATVLSEDRHLLREANRVSTGELQPWKCEFRIVIAGQIKWIGGHAMPRRTPDGRVVWHGLLLDISARKLIDKQLEQAMVNAEQANRAKSAFLAAMSHEIRTPMNGVIGMADVLCHSGLPADQADTVMTIRQSAFALLRIIDDILDFSKIEAGRLQLEAEPLNLLSLVEGVCESLLPVAATGRVDLSLYVAPDLPEQVIGDGTRLRQVLYNLVGNAIKFSKGSDQHAGRVVVRVERGGDAASDVVFSVADNGIGMSADTLSKLFTPFTQGEVSTTRRFGGTGLGLAICRRLVALMKGTIGVTSEAGVGSTFSVQLPLQAAADTPVDPPTDLRGLTCLLVHHGDRQHEDLRRYLQHAGASVLEADDAGRAVEQARQLQAQTVCVHGVGERDATFVANLEASCARAADTRHLLVARGRRGSVRMVAANVASLDVLRRQTFLRAVAMVAGRASPEVAQRMSDDGISDLSEAAPSVEQARSEGRLVLVAEDDAISRKVILRQLGMLGYAADIAQDGADALERWLEGGHALLLTDLHMPGLDGYELTTRIRVEEARTPDRRRVPILALTANAMKGEEARARAAGMDEYLTKPIELKTLRAALERWMPRATSVFGELRAEPRPKPMAPTPTTVFDLRVLRGLVGDDTETVCDFLAEYRKSAERLTAELLVAFGTGDLKAVAAIAHKLKSSSRSVGALALGELCAALEADEPTGIETIHQRMQEFQVAVRAADEEISKTLEALES